ncbi:hypothetical protein [Pseudidiomarina terrestris]|uniref:hypothetical protein n=1 Tax=Pseudidiomarina terrestris TaxID=2820060 RepID=UPI00264BC272|nr:hypothetical protein [Pseudidiomarina sp. 1ASP75-5]MDN7134567.1 hypothetical protein [Pseudidiomarina sp. 1ASP75-5]
MNKLLLITVFLVGLTGCSSAPEIGTFETKAETNKVVIYHYRPWIFRAGAINYIAASNEKPMTVIGNGTVFREVAEPGKLIYRAENYAPAGWAFFNPGGVLITNIVQTMEEKIRFTGDANQIYFVEWTPNGVRLTSESEAREVIPELSWNNRIGWPAGEEKRLEGESK